MLQRAHSPNLADTPNSDRVEGLLARFPNGLWVRREDAGSPWIVMVPRHGSFPMQGWKIHVSASVASARQVLAIVLPLLREEQAYFKLVKSPTDLELLNSGRGGVSQVGKFITVYPKDDGQFVRLALSLTRRCRSLSGPRVPTDRRVEPSSIVHYRYGGFSQFRIQTPIGESLPALLAPDGTPFADKRGRGFSPPKWARDPLVEAGHLGPHQDDSPLLLQRYLRLALIHESAKGGVYVALDVDHPRGRDCIVKRAICGGWESPEGGDGPMLLHNEMAVLRELAGVERVPAVYDYFQLGGDSYLVLERLHGEPLGICLASAAATGALPAQREVVSRGLEMCGILRSIHSRGVIHRDLKAGNWLIGDRGLGLVDFELAYHSKASPGLLLGGGTRGYASPQQQACQRPTAADDVYGLGALLYLLCTWVDPSLLPREGAFQQRWIDRLNPNIGPSLQAVVASCLQPDPARRFRRVEEVEESLAAVPVGERASWASPRQEPRSEYADIALRFGERLCQVAEEGTDGRLAWRKTGGDPFQRDFNIGSSGVVFFLVELFRYGRAVGVRAAAERGLRWLGDFDHSASPYLPGLLVGESGAGLASLRAAQSWKDPDFVDQAVRMSEAGMRSLPGSPDFFNGLAGVGFFNLILGDLLDAALFRRRAVDIGTSLLLKARHTEHGPDWVFPDGYEGLSGRALLGFAHGSAGIAHYLLELTVATGDGRFGRCAREVAESMARMAVPTLPDGEGANWPDAAGGQLRSLYWCHGAAGVGKFFVRAWEVLGDERYRDLACRAGRLVARGGRWLGPCQCHGLAGSIEFLIDLYQATRETEWLDCALDLGDLLRSWSTDVEAGVCWPSVDPSVLGPGFMVGYSGVGWCFLRLAQIETMPSWMSRKFWTEDW